ncbi:MAG: hypothetical protein ISS41_10725 [Candidatus Aminicenantes bacterium]|nr:hypothetical protein [Candidatus Aminicenantes bacterium]MBL7084083.1 hypothetical protein [Candidatus Aminicenantes bacterium]
MKRKSLSLIGIILLLWVMQSCSSPPEDQILKKYIHASNMGDRTTLSTMALEPVLIEAESWEITSVTEENVELYTLPELNKKEVGFKKQQEESIITTVEAKGDLDDAEFELERARTRAAKRAAQKKVDELKTRYEEIYANHQKLQTDYNVVKADAAREESITNFSLGAGDLPNIRELTGEVHFKEVEIKTVAKSETKNYKLYLRKYNLKDETLNLPRRGRWIIVKIEVTS